MTEDFDYGETEAPTPTAEQIRAQQLREAADKLESPHYMSAMTARDADYYSAMLGSLDADKRQEFEKGVFEGMPIGDLVHLYRRVGGASAPAATPRTVPAASPQAPNINNMNDADRRFNLPAGHPEKINVDQYTAARKRFGLSTFR